MLDFIGKWKDKIADYVDTRVQLVKLEVVERVSQVLSFFTFTIICVLLLMPILLFAGMGGAEFIADAIDSRGGGYLIMAGIYLVLLLILYAGRKFFIKKFEGLFIGVMTDNNDDDEEETSK